MIIVKIKQTDRQITASFEGHAGYERAGKDIVCAGVSALFFALIYGVRKLAPESLTVEGTAITIINPSKEVKGAFTAILEGLRAIGEDYESYLSIRSE